MMKQISLRRGSALLIVLGMVAFMIASALAFSVYMRFSRLPSSYLRRTVASRQLVKAALARAIDEVDCAIANNLHPGLGSELSRKSSAVSTVSPRNRNFWKGRVFFGTNEFAKIQNTIPILTLEGLAYIPPSLVNEARHYSRLSPAAEWRSFGFDAGRYAFCALDVSDCFDVNRMSANRPRSSTNASRISLAYLFEDYQHTSAGTDASAWDQFMSNFRDEDPETLGFKYDNKVPLISGADLTLALGNLGPSAYRSPLYNYLQNGSGFDNFGGMSEEYRVNSMNFVTDSWFPLNQADDEDYANSLNLEPKKFFDLESIGQPIPYDFLDKDSASDISIPQLLSISTEGASRLVKKMPLVTFCALYDYLDKNRVPISLAIPTVERAPMICGIKPLFSTTQLKAVQPVAGLIVDQPSGGNQLNWTAKQAVAYQTVQYKIDGTAFAQGLAFGLESLCVYPFAHGDGINDKFNLDGRVSFFFTPSTSSMKLRTNTTEDLLHLQNKDFATIQPGSEIMRGIISFPLRPITGRSFGRERVEDELQIIDSISMQAPDALALAPVLANTAVMEVTYKWNVTWTENPGGGGGTYQPQDYIAAKNANALQVEVAKCNITPLNENGQQHPDYSTQAKFTDLVRSIVQGGAAPELKLNFAPWLRITNESNETVDLVPAHMKDDRTFNNVMNELPSLPEQVSGRAFPIMKFDTGVTLRLDLFNWETANPAQSVAAVPEAAIVDDPRYNYAPEHWRAVPAAQMTKEEWLANNKSDRNGDIFFATSDQCYLQSIYELAFLPRLSGMVTASSSSGTSFTGSNYQRPDQSVRTQIEAEPVNAGLMWENYRLYGAGSDNFDAFGFKNAGAGFKINPYTAETNVLMAAFANTPRNWRMASTNNQEVTLEEMSAAQYNARYAWNEYSSGAQFKWKDLEGLAREFMMKICSDRQGVKPDQPPRVQNLSMNWEAAWEKLWENADDDPSRFGGMELTDTNLWSVDRKFLYGYWRDCFATRQQLFLIFVRAEPMMMGGGAMSKIPPQLGARAVALVWRDPLPPIGEDDNNAAMPHRTRILFYKQLD